VSSIQVSLIHHKPENTLSNGIRNQTSFSLFLTGIAGLGVTYGLSLNVLQATVIWNICNAENKMISVERILQHSKIPSEAPLVIDDQRPLDNWPNVGSIVFRDLQVNNKVDVNTFRNKL